MGKDLQGGWQKNPSRCPLAWAYRPWAGVSFLLPALGFATLRGIEIHAGPTGAKRLVSTATNPHPPGPNPALATFCQML